MTSLKHRKKLALLLVFAYLSIAHWCVEESGGVSLWEAFNSTFTHATAQDNCIGCCFCCGLAAKGEEAFEAAAHSFSPKPLPQSVCIALVPTFTAPPVVSSAAVVFANNYHRPVIKGHSLSLTQRPPPLFG